MPSLTQAIAIILGTCIMCGVAHARETWLVNGKEDTKVNAVKAKILDSRVEVVRCVPQELTEKLTLRAEKKIK